MKNLSLKKRYMPANNCLTVNKKTLSKSIANASGVFKD
jgi:hypothetical protein